MRSWVATARLVAAFVIASGLTAVTAQADTGAGLCTSMVAVAPQRPLTQAESKAKRELEAARRRLSHDHDPNDSRWQHDVIMADQELGDLFVVDGDLADARQAYSCQLEDARRWVAGDPRYIVRQASVAVADEKIGDVMLAQGDTAGARAAYEEDLGIARRLLAASDTMQSDDLRRTKRANQLDVSISLQKVGDALAAQGDRRGAREHYSEALGIVRDLARDTPNDRDVQRDTAVYLWHLAEFGDTAVRWADVVAQLEKMAAKHMVAPEEQNWLPEARRREIAQGDR
jgi:predicted negative regulator of RcsB-dependent stress response